MTGHRWETITDLVLAAAVFVTALVVYVVTLTPTVPFWDSGEFIATSYILGIPHPPGTPLYVLLGRVFSMLPLGESIAERVNMLSAIPSALAVMLSFLVTNRILAGCGAPFCSETSWPPRPSWTARLGALSGAFMMAFSFTFWNNAIEAEVYALSSMVMVGCVYLMLKWRDLRHLGPEAASRANNVVVLVFYLLALSISFHMGAFIVFLPLVLFFLSDYYKNLADPRFIVSSLCILILSFVLGFHGGQMLLSGILICVLAIVNLDIAGFRNFASLMVALVVLVLGGYLMANVGPIVGIVAALGIGAFVYGMWSRSLFSNNLGFWVASVFVVGLSVHVFLVIRASLDPAINEADPSTLENFWLVISRDQYKPGPPTERRGDFVAAFDTHFWRYWMWQYRNGIDVLRYLPIALGLGGAILGAWRSRRTFLLMLFIVVVTSLGLIWHLNFRADEVRDRDYFFVAFFHFFTIWIGMGVSAVIYLLREAVPAGFLRKVTTAAVGIVFLLYPLGQLRAGWFEHDRSGFYVARDYAHNILQPLQKDAIIFTNGDNDTFPLWYLQEVEGIRTDVRVANLSLLNTEWYIKQLRDLEPKVPIRWNDEEIESLDVIPDRRLGRYLLIRDQAVREIVLANNWERPLYIAVTVPDLMGFDDPAANQLVMEGLAWRINPTPTSEAVDIELLEHNLKETFLWRGLLDENGDLDRTVHRDDTAMKLVGNYAAAHIRLALAYTDRSRDLQAQGRYEDAEREMKKAVQNLEQAEVFNDQASRTGLVLGSLYHTLGQFAQAESLYTSLLDAAFETQDRNLLSEVGQLHYQRGEVRYEMGDYAGARADFEVLVQRGFDQWPAYSGLARSLAAMGLMGEALELTETWLSTHPDHAEALDYKRRLEEATSTDAPAVRREEP